jgi:hypothetical protein
MPVPDSRVQPPVVAVQATSLPVLAVLDHDDADSAARDRLTTFSWSTAREIVSLNSVYSCGQRHDLEAEDLWPTVLKQMIGARGADVAVDVQRRCGNGDWHIAVAEQYKDAAAELPAENAQGGGRAGRSAGPADPAGSSPPFANKGS